MTKRPGICTGEKWDRMRVRTIRYVVHVAMMNLTRQRKQAISVGHILLEKTIRMRSMTFRRKRFLQSGIPMLP